MTGGHAGPVDEWLGSLAAFEERVIEVGRDLGVDAAVARQMVWALLRDVLACAYNVRIGLPPRSQWRKLRDGDGHLSAHGYAVLKSYVPHSVDVGPISLSWWRQWYEEHPAADIVRDFALHLGFRLHYEHQFRSPPREAFLELRAAAIEPAMIQRLAVQKLTGPPEEIPVRVMNLVRVTSHPAEAQPETSKRSPGSGHPAKARRATNADYDACVEWSAAQAKDGLTSSNQLRKDAPEWCTQNNVEYGDREPWKQRLYDHHSNLRRATGKRRG